MRKSCSSNIVKNIVLLRTSCPTSQPVKGLSTAMPTENDFQHQHHCARPLWHQVPPNMYLHQMPPDNFNMYLHQVPADNLHKNLQTKQRCQVRGNMKKDALPRATDKTCTVHNQPVVHVPCDVMVVQEELADSWNVYCEGGTHHSHRPPPAIKPTHETASELRQMILAAPNQTPSQMAIGTPTRPAAGQLHPSLQHLGRLAHHKRKVVAPTKPQHSFTNLVKQHQQFPSRFKTSMSTEKDRSHIIVTSMLLLEAFLEYCTPLETDTVHGAIHDPAWDGVVEVTMTSFFNPVVRRQQPLTISIMYQLTSPNYCAHFMHPIAAFVNQPSITSPQMFVDEFPGNASDFSEAERVGFLAACKEALEGKFGEGCCTDLDFAPLYKYCKFHQIQSMERVARQTSIIPRDQAQQFRADWLSLTNVEVTPTFDELCRSAKRIYELYPKARGWFDWYLNPSRAAILFPQCRGQSAQAYEKLPSTTNSQERQGGLFKQTAPQKKMTPGEAQQHVYNFLFLAENDYRAEQVGTSVRYQRPAQKKTKKNKKKKYFNDGKGT